MVGDTAQTIAEGSTSKVSNIDSIFAADHHATPSKHNLSYNYRSTNEILQAANLVVGVISTLFPASIDVMVDEVSAARGPKPYLIGRMPDD